MKCEYTLNGKTDPTHTALFNYVANTPANKRSTEEVYKVLREAGIAIRKNDAAGNPRMYLVMGTDLFKIGEEEDKQMQKEYQQENTVIKEMEESD